MSTMTRPVLGESVKKPSMPVSMSWRYSSGRAHGAVRAQRLEELLVAEGVGVHLQPRGVRVVHELRRLAGEADADLRPAVAVAVHPRRQRHGRQDVVLEGADASA
jgi:hypothetical protein